MRAAILRPGRSRGRGLRYKAGAVTVAAAGLAAVSLLAASGAAVAAPSAPKPTVAEVQKKIAALNIKADKLDQQLNQAKDQLSAANERLKIVNRQAARYSKQFNQMRAEIGRIAAQAYMQGSLNNSLVLLTSSKPQQILDQSSILLELSSSNTAQMDKFLSAAKALTSAQKAAQRTRAGIASLKASLAKRKAALDKLIAKEKTLLASLTPPERHTPGPGPGGGTGGGGGGGGGGAPKPPPPGSGSGAAAKAVSFAYAQIGCPYVFGGVGPCNSGFDCSGLMQAAWSYAGVSIPRVSYDQISSLPAVSLSDLQPGDILGFSGNSHVGMYVGGGYLIDAPHTGLNVEKVKLGGYYTPDAAVRP
jgi:peptidoglycan DL-endopeptidase CwlO